MVPRNGKWIAVVMLVVVLCIGCAVNAAAELTVQIVQPTSDPASANANEWVTFEAVAYDDGVELDDTTVQWSWDFGDSTQSTDNPAYHVYTATGEYVATVTATVGQASATATVTVDITTPSGLSVTIDEPTPSEFPPPVSQSTTYHATAYMDGVALDDAEVQWQWSFGDGTDDSTDNPAMHSYDAAGEFVLVVTATYGGLTAVATLPLRPGANAAGVIPPTIDGFSGIYVTSKPRPQADIGGASITVDEASQVTYPMWSSDYDTWGLYRDGTWDGVEHQIGNPTRVAVNNTEPAMSQVTSCMWWVAPPVSPPVFHPGDDARIDWTFDGGSIMSFESDAVRVDRIVFAANSVQIVANARFPGQNVRTAGSGTEVTIKSKTVNIRGSRGWLEGDVTIKDEGPADGAMVQLFQNGVACGNEQMLPGHHFAFHNLVAGEQYTVKAWVTRAMRGIARGQTTQTVVRIQPADASVVLEFQ